MLIVVPHFTAVAINANAISINNTHIFEDTLFLFCFFFFISLIFGCKDTTIPK